MCGDLQFPGLQLKPVVGFVQACLLFADGKSWQGPGSRVSPSRCQATGLLPNYIDIRPEKLTLLKWA
jgi:hypothetical protein